MAEVLPALRTSLSAPLSSAANRGGLPWDQQATGGAGVTPGVKFRITRNRSIRITRTGDQRITR